METKREVVGYGYTTQYQRGNVDLSVQYAGLSRKLERIYHVYVNGFREEELPKISEARRYNERGFYSVKTDDIDQEVERILDELDGTKLYVNFLAKTK